MPFRSDCMKKHFIFLFTIILLSAANAAQGGTNLRNLLISSDSLIFTAQNAVAQGLYDKATELGEQNVRMLKKEIIEDHEYKAKAMLSLAHAYAACGDWEQAWKNANNSAGMYKRLYP